MDKSIILIVAAIAVTAASPVYDFHSHAAYHSLPHLYHAAHVEVPPTPEAPHKHIQYQGYYVTVLFALVAIARAGVIVPAHPVVAHPVVAHRVVAPVHTVSHSAVIHPAPVVHAPVVHAAPIVHAPVVHAAPIVPVVKHAPLIAVHH
ncbi:unnamed protein product [Chrysodeixis includens]|uniref:Cuticle protein n=1 Tax=Chrysodeixis includens TaxID=689277 RepID=A0A9N8PYY0_CHRIL|nr:unnamed protein product [Chrysodeixis includens]